MGGALGGGYGKLSPILTPARRGSFIDTDIWANITRELIERAMEPVKTVIREAKLTFDRSYPPPHSAALSHSPTSSFSCAT